MESALQDQRDYLARMFYNDGRTDGRLFCRTHSQEERAAELIAMRATTHWACNVNEKRYSDGYIDILSTWVDDIGA